MREGFRTFLGVILLGQTELRHRLDAKDHSIREIAQRCQVITLPPLTQQELRAYLAHRFARVGAKLSDVVDESGLAELYRRLSDAKLCYPLAAHNLLGRAMGAAARVRAPVVDGRAVKGV
jgi:type II secretory pathway predicted ATPase ExeA